MVHVVYVVHFARQSGCSQDEGRPVIFVFILLPFGILDSSLLEKIQQLFLFEICYIVIFSAIQCGERLCELQRRIPNNNARDETRETKGNNNYKMYGCSKTDKCGRYI